jgi:membrane-associated protease RseP (regulator of RpoE activity)
MKKNTVLILVPLLACALAFAAEEEAGSEKEQQMEKRGWLGVYASDLSEPMTIALNIDHGVLITDVVDESPAKEAGFEKGDVVIEIDGEKIEDGSRLRHVVRKRPGKKVNALVHRRGKAKRIGVTLAEQAPGPTLIDEYDWTGIPGEAVRVATKALKRIGPDIEKKVQVQVLKDDELADLKEELEELKQELEQELKDLRKQIDEIKKD